MALSRLERELILQDDLARVIFAPGDKQAGGISQSNSHSFSKNFLVIERSDGTLLNHGCVSNLAAVGLLSGFLSTLPQRSVSA
jgi:hypothetical protein